MKKEIIQDFLESTPVWAKSLIDGDLTKQCIICGTKPANMLELAEAIKILKEKAGKYDNLCK